MSDEGDKRLRILTAAIAHFAQTGLSQARIADIAAVPREVLLRAEDSKRLMKDPARFYDPAQFNTAFDDLAAMIRRREISCVELMQVHLDQIARVNPTVNAIITLLPEAALREARAADEKLARGEAARIFTGAPLPAGADAGEAEKGGGDHGMLRGAASTDAGWTDSADGSCFYEESS